MGAKIGKANLSTRFEILSPEDRDPRWDAYVASNPQGTIFHTCGMLRAFATAPKHEVLAMAAVGDDHSIQAIIPAVKVSTLSGIGSHISSRSIWYAEPICEPTEQGRAALEYLTQLHDRRARSCLFTEVRNIAAAQHEKPVLQDCGYQYKDYLNYVVDTSDSVENLFRRVSKSTRNKIRRTEKRGVAIELDNSHTGIDQMYRMVYESYARSEVPLANETLFHTALDELPKNVQVRLAVHEGDVIAGGISLVYGDRFFAWYGGSLRQNSLSPFDLLTWDEIKWSSENGSYYYDFGGAGWPDEEYGPREFKKKFGGDLVDYGRYRRIPSPLKLKLAESAYQIARSVISR